MTGTFVLVWGAKKLRGWPVEAYESAIASTADGHHVTKQWSTGNRKHDIAPGDRAFLLRMNRERGLVACGRFTSGVSSGPHWDGSPKTSNLATVEWETVLAPEDRLEIDVLERELPRKGKQWMFFQGGEAIHDAPNLEELWASHIARLGVDLSSEKCIEGTYPEGALIRDEVNRYKRDRSARRACIDRWGVKCSVCGIDFEKTYGPVGKGFIHVHHLRELSTVGDGYEVDPVADLRPLCPNCHAMVHTKRPAMTIDELQAELEGAAGLSHRRSRSVSPWSDEPPGQPAGQQGALPFLDEGLPDRDLPL